MLTRARVLAVGALVIGALGSYLWLQSGGDGDSSSPGRAAAAVAPDSGLRAALRFVPANAPFVGVLQTNVNNASVRAALELADSFTGAQNALTQIEELVHGQTGLDVVSQLPQLIGNPVVVAGSAENIVAAWQTFSAPALESALTAAVDSGDLRATGTYRSASIYSAPAGVAVASIGPTIVAGSSMTIVRQAIDRSRGASPSITATQFESRAAGLPRSAVLRAVAGGTGMRAVVRRFYAPAAAIPWVAALSDGAIALSAASDGLHAVIRMRTAPGVLTPDDLPIAPGARAPVLTGSAGMSVGVRDLAHLGHFVLSAGEATKAPLIASYKDVDKLLTQFAHIDLDQDILSTLTGSATISSDDLQHFTLRAETTDPGGVEDVLSRISGIGRIGGFLGVDLGGFSVDTDDDGMVTISHDDTPIVTLGVRNDLLVASTDPSTDFDELADSPEREGGASPARGALRARVSPKAVVGLLQERLGLPSVVADLIEPLGQAVITASATDGDITVRAFLPVS